MFAREADRAPPGAAGGAPPPRAVLDVALERLSHGGVPVLGRLGLSVATGETVALTGPSGIGKTSLLRAVAGLHREYEGRIVAPERIAMVFQEPLLLRWRSALRNITIAAGVDDRTARAALADVGLDGLGDRFPGQLSLGQQRRLSMARAFAARPDLLLMDEPFVSLDTATADEMMALFESLAAARPVATVLVTHSGAEARRLASRILRLEGRPATLAA